MISGKQNNAGFSDEELRKLQLLQLDMLVELDKVCRKHSINYLLSSGSMLGAIRHKGYIPWDDDADIAMLREDYNKFIKVAGELDSKICFFQDHSVEPEYRWGYGKLRRTGTSYVRKGQEHLLAKDGLFIDIFPLDDVPNSAVGAYIQQFFCYCARKITYSEIGKCSCSGFGKLWYSLLSKINVDWAFKIFNFYAKRSSNASPNRAVLLSWPQTKVADKYSNGKKYGGGPKTIYLNTVDYEFEGFLFKGAKDYDCYLSRLYGSDYMTPPSLEKRHGNSPMSSFSFGNAEPIYSLRKTKNSI